MPTPSKQSLQLIERLADGSLRTIPLESLVVQPLAAKAGAQYALIDIASGKAPEGLVLKRNGQALVIEQEEGDELAEIAEFFQQPDVTFVPQAELEGEALSGAAVDATAPVLETTDAGEPVIWRAADDDGLFTPLNLGLGGAGLGAIGAAVGGGGGGSSGGAAAVAVVNTVTGVIVGGPVLASNDLRVEVFQADGVTKLGEAKVNADGSFSIAVGDYLGVVIAKVVNTGSGADYQDEATEAGKDLNAQLFAMEVVREPNSTVTVNLNVLTTLAYHKAQDAAGSAAPTAAVADDNNAAIAALFGLDSLHGITVAPTNGGSYDSGDGISAGEQYGAILAALSGADARNGGDSQRTIDDLLAGLTVSGGNAQLAEAAQAIVVQGAEHTSAQTGQSLTGNIAVVVDTFAPTFSSGASAGVLTENSGAGQVVYTAAAVDASGTVNYSLKSDGDAALFSIDAGTGAVTLLGNPDHETKAGYTFTVVATDAAGNRGEQVVSLSIGNLDDTAPVVTSGATASAITENSGAGQVVYTVTSDDTADISGGVTYSLKAVDDHAAFTIDGSTGAVTLTGDPDYETKASYAFTVVATDAAGNASERAVTLVINDIADETAPTVSSVALSGATGAQNSTLNAGDVVEVTVTMSEATTVTGTPRIALTIGGSTVYADYASGSGSASLVFSYTIQSGDTDTNGIAIAADALQLNGGTLRDSVGNAANLAHGAVGDNAGYLVDSTAPAFSSGTTADIDENSGAGQVVYTAAATDAAAVTYSLKAVDDHAALTIDGSTGEVTLTGDPDYETKTSYAFTVVATDAAGNVSERAVTLAVNDVDDTAPTVSSVALSGATGAQNSTLNAGDVVQVTVTMSEAITVTGTPRIALTIGGSTVYANYASGSGGTALVFQYTIQGGDTDANGIAIAADALELNGGTLQDAAGNDAVLTHALVADNAGYLVDTTLPTFSSGTTASAITENSGAEQVVYTAAATDAAAVTYSLKAVDDHAAFSIDAATGEVTLTADPDYETKASYAFTVVATDAAGNASERAVTLAVNDVDDTVPTVSSVALSGATGAQNSTLNAGDVVEVTVTMSEATTVTGTPRIALNVGGSTVYADYTSGSGSASLVFSYTIQGGDTDANGIAIAADALDLNGGTLKDGTGNDAVLTHGAVGDNAGYLVDTTLPTFSSGTTASAITENSGAEQVVYTAAASDAAAVTYSLKAVDDHAAFTIDGSTGAVTLTGDPDFEAKASYAFTVVATDAGGNASERSVTLAINDVADETAPTVSSVALSGATGAQNSRLNAGDVVQVTVTMSEATDVTGTPRVALTIGASTVYATYASGSGTTALVFSYTIQGGDTDANGISIAANALQLNGGTLQDAAGNDAVLTHALVADNAGYLVDSTAPTLSSSTPADDASAVAVGSDIVLTFSETVLAGSGDIVISNGTDTRTIAVTDTDQVTVSGSTVTINPTGDLQAGTTYHVQMASGVLTDQAGNAYAGISDSSTLNFQTAPNMDTSIVVFDLVEGVSSSHSGRVFDSGISYTIYIRMDSDSRALSIDGTSSNPGADWGMWTGDAGSLGADDKIIFVGDGSPIIGNFGQPANAVRTDGAGGFHLMTGTATNEFALFVSYAFLSRATGGQRSSATLWMAAEGSTHHLWASAEIPNLGFAEHYLTQMPAGILTSQGLV